jgi:nucleotide-binding universal stress UspA family protein
MRIPVKKILCATDFSDCSATAVRYGIALAAELNAVLYVCHVIDVPFAGMYGEANPDPVQLERRSMAFAREQMKELIGDVDLKWEPIVTVGHTADEIARIAGEKGVELVVSGTHGRSGLKRFLLGSVTERLMRVVACPLMVVRVATAVEGASGRSGVGFNRILVGCDFSPFSGLAVQHGINLAQEFEAELHLVHVLEWSAYKDVIRTGQEVMENIRHDVAIQMREKLEQLIPEDARNWCKPVINLVAGRPDEELGKYALVNDIDLIVVGIRGRGLMETLFVGSNTDRLVRQAPCPVLSVRPLVDEEV